MSYVEREGERVPLEKLPTHEREAFALRLKRSYLNELFRGTGRFWPEEEKKTSVRREKDVL